MEKASWRICNWLPWINKMKETIYLKKNGQKIWLDISQKDNQLAEKDMKSCTSLLIRKMQMKTTMKCHYTYTRVAEKCWQYQVLVKIRATGTLILCWWDCTLVELFGKQLSTKLQLMHTLWPSSFNPRYVSSRIMHYA